MRFDCYWVQILCMAGHSLRGQPWVLTREGSCHSLGRNSPTYLTASLTEGMIHSKMDPDPETGTMTGGRL